MAAFCPRRDMVRNMQKDEEMKIPCMYMKAKAVIVLLLVVGCFSAKDDAPLPVKNWKPWYGTITSPQQLTEVLEARWNPESVRYFCTRSTPWPARLQNLVVSGERWDGVLHREKNTYGYEITWYASASNHSLEIYSINVRKGAKHWILEAGNHERLAQPPDLNAKLAPK
jgi:hypothetical protein